MMIPLIKIGNVLEEQNLRKKVIEHESRCGNQDMSDSLLIDLGWSRRRSGDQLKVLYSLALCHTETAKEYRIRIEEKT